MKRSCPVIRSELMSLIPRVTVSRSASSGSKNRRHSRPLQVHHPHGFGQAILHTTFWHDGG